MAVTHRVRREGLHRVAVQVVAARVVVQLGQQALPDGVCVSRLPEPLVMGTLYGSFGSYAIGLILLAAVAAAALAFTGTGLSHAVSRRATAHSH